MQRGWVSKSPEDSGACEEDLGQGFRGDVGLRGFGAQGLKGVWVWGLGVQRFRQEFKGLGA